MRRPLAPSEHAAAVVVLAAQGGHLFRAAWGVARGGQRLGRDVVIVLINILKKY